MSAFLVVAIIVVIVIMLIPGIEPYVDKTDEKDKKDEKEDQPQPQPQPLPHRHRQVRPEDYQPLRVNADPLNNYLIIPDRPYPMLAKNAYLPSYQNMPLPIDNRSQQELAQCNPSLPHTCRVDGVAVGVQGHIF